MENDRCQMMGGTSQADDERECSDISVHKIKKLE